LDADAISPKKLIMKKDTIVKSVVDKYKQRSEVGIKKYNKTMDRDDLNLLDWLTHLQEELMDATLYVEKLKQEFKKK
jgi:succinate dehydrogenase flavin-adding protein (antitoxin of CptAB toxin-antitoxin module)